jgi:hypothetical protein
LAEVATQMLGMYRAKVVDNKDAEKFGRVLLWIPDLMPLLQDDVGLWARPANNPVGGRNEVDGSENYYAGTCYIPKKGSWVWVFFEAGNINRPYYFAALDIESAKVLAECQAESSEEEGSEYEHKWVIFKSHDGRCIVVSDDLFDARVEITGKKRQITTPPSGDVNSVYTIDGNQTTILFDERVTKEKILIRTYKGDFFHIDIDEQKLQAYFASDIVIKTSKSFLLYAEEDINLKSGAKLNLDSASDMNMLSDANINQEATDDFNIRASGNLNRQSFQDINDLATGNINSDATLINDQTGVAGSAGIADPAEEADPKGERDT